MRQRSKCLSFRRAWTIGIIISLSIIGVILLAHFKIVIVHGNSMYPTLRDGQMLIVSKDNAEIERGSIIVFKKDDAVYIKRVIALEGDIVAKDAYAGYLAVNSVEIMHEKPEHTSDPEISVIPKDCFFVLGDNYSESIDSRNSEVGLVSKEEIIGVAKE